MTITWFAKHMGNNAYDTQNISIWVNTHMIHNNHYIMLMFMSFTTSYFLHICKLQENLIPIVKLVSIF